MTETEQTTVTLYIKSFADTPFGMFSTIHYIDKTLYVLEPPWKLNQQNISCIPSGRYRVIRSERADGRETWRVLDVPDRTHILFHSGNVLKDTYGCLMLGQGLGAWSGQWCITDSLPAMAEFERWLEGVDEFTLHIGRPMVHPKHNEY